MCIQWMPYLVVSFFCITEHPLIGNPFQKTEKNVKTHQKNNNMKTTNIILLSQSSFTDYPCAKLQT